MFSAAKEVGIDLGTANTLVCLRGRGIILREPSVVAVDRRDDRVVAVGAKARAMLGRTPEEIIREDGRSAENGIAGAPESQGERPDPQRYVNV